MNEREFRENKPKWESNSTERQHRKKAKKEFMTTSKRVCERLWGKIGQKKRNQSGRKSAQENMGLPKSRGRLGEKHHEFK